MPSDVSVTGQSSAPSRSSRRIAEAEDAERAAAMTSSWSGPHRVRLGSIADALLHSSAVPVALAPIGFGATTRGHAHHLCNRRPGDDEILLDYAIRTAAAWKVPLRLMSLIAVGKGIQRQQEWTKLAKLHLNHVAETAGETTRGVPGHDNRGARHLDGRRGEPIGVRSQRGRHRGIEPTGAAETDLPGPHRQQDDAGIGRADDRGATRLLALQEFRVRHAHLGPRTTTDLQRRPSKASEPPSPFNDDAARPCIGLTNSGRQQPASQGREPQDRRRRQPRLGGGRRSL